MLYLLLDYYKESNDFIKILKIGYSSKEFYSSRESAYNTHNYGYEFLGEIDGEKEDETRLHKKYKHLAMPGSDEWFRYSEDIVEEFYGGSVGWDEPEINEEEIAHEILRLSRKYMDQIIDPDFLLGTYTSIRKRMIESEIRAKQVWEEMIRKGLDSYDEDIATKIEATETLMNLYNSSDSETKYILAKKVLKCTPFLDYFYIEIDEDKKESKVVICSGFEKIERLAADLYTQDKKEREEIIKKK